jgi:hypothetical protein
MQELLDICFSRGWKCFCFDHGAYWIILDKNNYCIQINSAYFDSNFFEKIRKTALKSLSNEFMT